MSAPFHFRKIPTQVRGKLLYLPMYTRALALLLKQSCDDQGRIELDERDPVDVVARLCAAVPNERRRLPSDLDELVRVGYLRRDSDALVVVEQEQDWEQIDSSRNMGKPSSRARRHVGATSHPSQNYAATAPQNHQHDSSTRNHSVGFDRREENRKEEKREEQKREEGVQGDQAPYAPKTQPNPSLRSKDLEEAIGKGSESWGFDGQDIANQSERLKDLEANTPPQERPVPSPHLTRQAPLVTVVEVKPVQGQNPPSKGTTKPKTKGRRGSVGGEHPIPEDWAVNEANYEHGAKFYGYTRAHVDAEAQAFRDQYAANGKKYVDWDAHFRTFMRWQNERRYGKPPFVPAPVEPKRPMPPCPPPEPHIVEAAKRWGERMANGEKIDFKAMMKNVGMRLPELPPDPPELAQWRKEDGLDSL